MKNAILLFLFCLLISSCSDTAIEKQLNGNWYGETSFIDDEGDAGNIKLQLELDASSHDINMNMTLGIPDIGDLCTASISGSWNASSETLCLDLNDNATVKYTPLLAELAKLNGLSVSSLEAQLTNQINVEDGMDRLDIKKISQDYIILKLDDIASGAEITMYRQSE